MRTNIDIDDGVLDAAMKAGPFTTKKDAVEAGTTLGFVSREPTIAKRKPGPKRTEAQDKVSIPGPKRVIDQFRAFCTEQNVTLWEGLDILLQGRGR